MTRGQRNHNPLNIRRVPGAHWLGEQKEVTDRDFVQFRCDLMGYRAAFRVLRTYIKMRHLHSISALIQRWAPPEDGNDTSAYIYLVCQRTGLTPGQRISFDDKDTMIKIVEAMARVESGITDIPYPTLEEAYQLAR